MMSTTARQSSRRPSSAIASRNADTLSAVSFVFSSATVTLISSPQGGPGARSDYAVAPQIIFLLKSNHGLRGARSEIAIDAERVAKIAQPLLDKLYVCAPVALTKGHAWIGGRLIARRRLLRRGRHWNCRNVVP